MDSIGLEQRPERSERTHPESGSATGALPAAVDDAGRSSQLDQ